MRCLWDRAHGIPAFLETRSYVQKVQNAYVRENSIHRDEDAERIVDCGLLGLLEARQR